jgi:hypothetical protein
MEPTRAKLILLFISVILPLLLILLGAVFNFGGILLVMGSLVWMGSTLIIFLPFLEEEERSY